jgi:hypothetical protein
MALDFTNAATDRVDHGSAANLDDLDPGTWLFWCKPTGLVNSMALWGKKLNGFNFAHRINVAQPVANFEIRATWLAGGGNTTYITNNANLQNDTWYFIAVTFDSSLGANFCHIYLGTLTSIAVELAYGTATDGNAPISDAAANWYIGNHETVAATFADNWEGDIAWYSAYSGVLSLAQIIQMQFRPSVRRANCVVSSHYGYNGVGTQADLSGNGNTGAVTGATVNPHVPLGPFFGWDNSLPFLVPVTTQLILTPYGGYSQPVG